MKQHQAKYKNQIKDLTDEVNKIPFYKSKYDESEKSLKESLEALELCSDRVAELERENEELTYRSKVLFESLQEFERIAETEDAGNKSSETLY